MPFVGNRAGVTSTDTSQYPFGYIFGTSSFDGGVKTHQSYYGSSTSSTSYSYYYIPSSLKEVTITGGYIPYGAFSKCKSLTSVTIGDSVTSIGKEAFSYCSNLTSIEIPDSVTSIGPSAFTSCTSLTKVNYTGTIDQWAQMSFGNSSSNPLSNGADLYINNELITNANISTVTKINAYAFYNCTSLTSVVIGDSVTSIGEYAFYNCLIENATIPTIAISYIPKTNLKTIVITSGESINSHAFSGCTSLTNVTIGDRVTSIGDYAFSRCTSLTSVTIGDSVTSIGEKAFSNCTSLTRINFNGTKAQWDAISKGSSWKEKVKANVFCTDGIFSI